MMKKIAITKPAVLALALLVPLAASARVEPFALGTILVTAPRPQVGEVASEQVSSVVSQEQMRTYNRETVGDALNLLSGVTISNNSRNEQTVYLRGYDSRQTPLFIDGIPVYVPYDGYVDFGRFNVADLSAIQVAKGFSSVTYGPNTLGGAINLISRKPREPFEGDVRVGAGQGNERLASFNVGSNQGFWYVQAGASHRESDYFRLSSDFKPTPHEDGGRRENSYRKDRKLSLKLGLTPAGSDEYALSYYRQDSKKGQPPSTDFPRFWKWPHWDKESLYFISRTGLGDHETLRLRLYNDRFDNEVNSYTDNTYRVLRTSGPGSVSTGRSIYNDKTYGGAVELESRRLSGHTVRLSLQQKVDRHQERDANDRLNSDFRDTLRTIAIEDAIEIGDLTLLSVGYARNELRPDKVFNRGNPYALPGNKFAHNVQAGLFHDLSDTARVYAHIAQKTRLPSLKDRYSQRLGNFVENPGLKQEKAINHEIGYQGQPWPGALADAALFLNDVRDKIQAVNLGGAASCSNVTPCQMQNVGKVRVSGVELGLRTPLGPHWEAGGNLTLMRLKNRSDASVKLTNVPETKLTAHVLWRPVSALDVVAFAEHNSSRWSSNTVKTSGFTVLNVKADWRPVRDLNVEVGANNVTDKDYELEFGFPNPGRMVFANVRYQF